MIRKAELYSDIFTGCCLDKIKAINTDSIDVVVTSVPYNMNLRIRDGKYCSRQIVKEISTKYDSFDDNLPLEEYNDFHTKVLNELLRVTKHQIFYNIAVVTGSKRSLWQMIGDFRDYLKEIVVWDKGHGQPAMGDGVLNRQSELILVFEKNNAISRKFDNAKFERGTLGDIWQINRQRSTHKANTAVFPDELVCKILDNFTDPGDWVLDPFMGTGTTGVCSKLMGRNFIGCELSPQLANHAKARIAGTLRLE